MGLLPGLIPRILADSAILSIVGTRVGDRTAVLTLSTALDAPGYAPLPLAVLVGANGEVTMFLALLMAVDIVVPIDLTCPVTPWLVLLSVLAKCQSRRSSSAQTVQGASFRPTVPTPNPSPRLASSKQHPTPASYS